MALEEETCVDSSGDNSNLRKLKQRESGDVSQAIEQYPLLADWIQENSPSGSRHNGLNAPQSAGQESAANPVSAAAHAPVLPASSAPPVIDDLPAGASRPNDSASTHENRAFMQVRSQSRQSSQMSWHASRWADSCS
jgi:hypothetical protein